MKLLGSKTYHTKEGAHGKLRIPTWFTYQPGEEVADRHVEALLRRGAELEGKKPKVKKLVEKSNVEPEPEIDVKQEKKVYSEKEVWAFVKKEQVALLKAYGLKPGAIRKLSKEAQRVLKILALQKVK